MKSTVLFLNGKTIACAALAAVLLSVTGCADTSSETTIGGEEASSNSVESNVTSENAAADTSEAIGGGVQIPSPWVQYDSIAEMQTALDFDFAAPDSLGGLPFSGAQEMGVLAEATYSDGTSEITIRKGKGNDDVSGDYNVYDEEKTLNANGFDITAKGNDGKVMLAVWTADEYSYSISCGGVSDEEIVTFAEQITPTVEEVSLGGEEDIALGGGNVQIPNPWVEYGSLEEMNVAAGFAFNAPEAAAGLSVTLCSSTGEISEVTYSDGANEITIRMGKGSGDVSGDYNTYDETKTASVSGCDLTLSGNDGTIDLAVWCDGDYSYSISAPNGLSEDAVIEIAQEIIG